MTKILLIDTATSVCSAAIAVDGTVAALAEAPESLQHAALLTLQIEECVRRSGIALSELDAVAVSRGPGSYTSLRVGVSVAKGICYALGKRLIAVDTLHALAHASSKTSANLLPAGRPAYYLPMLDARRNEIWTCIYDARLRRLNEPQPVILENNSFVDYLAANIPDAGNAVFVVSGNGVEKLANVTLFENTVQSDIKKSSSEYLCFPAFELFQMNDFQDVAYFEPLYMKPPNITVSNKSFWHEKQ
jgi:tRNA threonylcarbamoyladenosine biosynthesis protein TsaB